jgi:hypothetical protein
MAGTQQEIRQLLTKHPELERHVPKDMSKNPRLVADNTHPRHRRVQRALPSAG